eukprot:TRINITY_DN15936_c0_g1_i1.p1 TRINITY_DN15936_c0_g1~~TRINITY_DN15936_c0_g1_i1.p1  ORF type:complete len:351 (+),score=67.89 TRINITY_DN15936_c0_g1_i1:54-1055(+)
MTNTNATSTEGKSTKVIHIKDPMTKDLVHEVPAAYISPTSGHRGKGHRPCLCRLFLEGRCGQGKKCKSYHVDKDFIAKKRAEHGVVIETSFITEVVVFEDTADTKKTVFAVRFPAVLRTKGLDNYRTDFSNETISPKKLCSFFRETGKCPTGAECPDIHVKAAELNGLKKRRLRTPCCAHHGDRFETELTSIQIMTTDNGDIKDIPLARLAENDSLNKVDKERIFALSDVCRPHITGRCKYGKSCENLHVCRTWFTANIERKPTETQVQECSDAFSASSGVCSSASSISSRSPSPSSAAGIFLNLPPETEAKADDTFPLPHWDEASPPDLGKM